VGDDHVVAHPLLDQAGEGRKHQRPVDAHLVHQLEAGRRLAEGGNSAHGLAHELAVRLALGVAMAEVLLLRTGARHHVEGGIGDVLADLALHGDLGAAAHLHVLDDALEVLGEELGEGVLRLVHVVVGVEDLEIDDS
jgi:hypothetical protein